MKLIRMLAKFIVLVSLVFLVIAPVYSKGGLSRTVIGIQTRNSINGIVFSHQRQPVNDLDVELLDDFSRSISRTRTSSAGRYNFNNLREGRYRVRVLGAKLGYEDQIQETEIVNFSRTSSSGTRTSGYENAQVDFYLKLIRSTEAKNKIVGTIFAQEIPPPAQKAYKEAVKALGDKENERAVRHLKEAINIFPDYYLALEQLGVEYIRLKEYEQAKDSLTKAAALNPRAFESWYGLAHAQFNLKNYEASVEAVQKAVELSSKSINALILFGVALKNNGRFNDAEIQLKKAEGISRGTISEIHWQLAKLYGENLKRYGEAADELELFLKTEPDNPNGENIRKLIKVFREKARNKNS
jgi:tetratricopeptide (TPR) repeat protein